MGRKDKSTANRYSGEAQAVVQARTVGAVKTAPTIGTVHGGMSIGTFIGVANAPLHTGDGDQILVNRSDD
ncbi:hypothetical protein GCM10027168_44640 [Streptomyces capparidis]